MDRKPANEGPLAYELVQYGKYTRTPYIYHIQHYLNTEKGGPRNHLEASLAKITNSHPDYLKALHLVMDAAFSSRDLRENLRHLEIKYTVAANSAWEEMVTTGIKSNLKKKYDYNLFQDKETKEIMFAFEDASYTDSKIMYHTSFQFGYHINESKQPTQQPDNGLLDKATDTFMRYSCPTTTLQQLFKDKFPNTGTESDIHIYFC